MYEGNSISKLLSHTSAHVVLFPLAQRVPWYQAPWPTSTQGFSDPIRFLFGRGGERAESKFSYTVAVIFVIILGNTSTWWRTLSGVSPTQPARLRRKLASPTTIDTEARRSSWEDANHVVKREDDECWLSTLWESQYYECLGEMQ